MNATLTCLQQVSSAAVTHTWEEQGAKDYFGQCSGQSYEVLLSLDLDTDHHDVEPKGTQACMAHLRAAKKWRKQRV